jgi:hypothetical protein
LEGKEIIKEVYHGQISGFGMGHMNPSNFFVENSLKVLVGDVMKM